VVVKGVEIDIELIGLNLIIPACHRRLDPLRLPVVKTSTDVDRIFADEHPHLGAFGGRLALRRISLSKTSCRVGGGPRAFLEPAINCDGALEPGSLDLRCSCMPLARSRVGRGGCLVLEGSDEGERKRDR
jgi:hypothetical protein